MPASSMTLLCLLVVSGIGSVARAEAVLNDWCLNINGNTTSACNPVALGGLPSSVNGTSFDFTLNSPPGTANNLGSLRITLSPGAGQYVLAYMDYDLNYALSGSFQDAGSVHGTPAAGVSYELGDPAGNIFSDFIANGLPNSNSVGSGSAPPAPCCDVAWALGMGGINLAAGSSALVTFTVSTVKPSSGFYLQQSNIADNETIYLSESLSQGVSTVPEPPSLPLFAAGLAFLLLSRRSTRRTTPT